MTKSEKQPMAEKEWCGPEDGLPPVGTMLENYSGEKRLVCLAADDHVVCMVMESLEKSRRYKAYYLSDFRDTGLKRHDPRSPEEKAVEEMLGFAQYADKDNLPATYRLFAQDLYRAGYRKESSE